MSGRDAAGAPPRPPEAGPALRPLLATGLSAAAIGGDVGAISYGCDTRGTPIDWGGVYASVVRLTGPWTLRIVDGERVTSLPAPGANVRRISGGWEVVHRVGDLRVSETVVVAPDEPAVGRSLRVEVTAGGPRRLLVESEFVPFLAPVILEGVKPYEYTARTRGTTVQVVSHGYALALDTSPLPTHLGLNGGSWIGGRWDGELGALMSDHELVAAPGEPAEIRWVVWGGLEATVRDDPGLGSRWLARAGSWREEAAQYRETWLASRPTLRFPQAPEIEEGYGLAIRALRDLYVSPTPTITGLVAGYPWYSSLWFRDLAWMLPAVIWLGDFDWATRSIRTAFRFQARRNLPVLGAEEGEVPMQVAPGPIFLFGTSDTTLHYPSLVRQLGWHVGGIATVQEFGPGVDAAIRWGRAKCDPSTGWLRNGGEVEAIDGATARIGSVHYGVDAVDTTIWDSADRRDHAVDVQSLWIGALEAAADLGGRGVGTGTPDALRADAARLRGGFRAFEWPDEGYLYDALRAQGPPVPRVRPNALRAVSAGLVPPTTAVAIVERATRSDLTTDWGLRTLSSSDPGYDPQAYHDGQVWSIATAWAADAALAVGDAALGERYLRILAGRLGGEAGMAGECYRGDRDLPFDSCFLLGFSVAPFLTVVFERLWGLTVGPDAGSLAIRPRFPEGWTEASLHGLRIGGGLVDIDWRPAAVTVRWSGTEPLRLDGPGGSAVALPGVPTGLPMAPSPPKVS